jgi:hypothetical protein
MDNELVQILLDIKADTAATRQAVTDITGRVDDLEQSDVRRWWVSTIGVMLAPVLVILHSFARKFGVNV